MATTVNHIVLQKGYQKRFLESSVSFVITAMTSLIAQVYSTHISLSVSPLPTTRYRGSKQVSLPTVLLPKSYVDQDSFPIVVALLDGQNNILLEYTE